MKKRLWVFLLILILFLSPVSAAEINRDAALKWLNGKVIGNEDVEEVAFSILALQGTSYESKARDLISQLELQMSSDGCFPKESCNVKDTAFALLALNSFNRPTEKIVEWLEEAKRAGTLTRDWYIQVKTMGEGDCKFSYEGIKKPKTINIDDNRNTGCGTRWVSVGSNNCIDMELSKVKTKDIEVDCSSLEDPSMIISLLRASENEIFIIQQERGNIVTLTIDNTCWGKTSGGKCDLDSTAYAYWALSEVTDIEPPAYLKTSLNKNAVHYSILYLKEGRVEYANWLESNQNKLGYWGDKEVYDTAFGIRANVVGTVEKALSWSASEQDKVGSWNNRILDTAVMLYATSTGDWSGGYCGNNEVEFGEECDGTNDLACPGNCISPRELNECTCQAVACEIDEDCSYGYLCNKKTGECVGCLNDKQCEDYEECDLITNTCIEKIRPTMDCDYDGRCEPEEGEDKYSCPDDCKGGFPTWIIWLIVILLILGLGWRFGRDKFFKKKPGEKKPSYLKKETKPRKLIEPVAREHKSVTRKPYDEYLERELDKSIKEAQKLLKKK